MVHEVARRGFGQGADAYERTRPTYPPEVVDWLGEHLRLMPGTVVADLAAGTGKLTRLLLPTGASVVAVEPVGGMRLVLRHVLPHIPTVAGTAEAMPFRTSSLDAVTVAQAFHWFDAEAAFGELARVLRPGGSLAMVWNARDRSVDWVARAWRIMDRVEKAAPWRGHDGAADPALDARPGFAPVVTATFRHEQICTPDDLLERFRGVSHVAVLSPERQEAVLDELRDLLGTHPDTRGKGHLRLPYRVDCYWRERLGWSG